MERNRDRTELRRDRGRRVAIGAALVLSLAALAVGWRARKETALHAQSDTPAATLDDALTPAPRHAPPMPSPSVTPSLAAPVPVVEPLRASFDSEDDAKKIAAVEAVVRDGRLDELPELAGVDLRREPASAPTIIHAIANLAAQGSSAQQRLGAKTLSSWLRQEARRDGKDAIGNVPNLVEALGDLGGRDAVDALVDALDSGGLDLSVQTLIVQRLAELGDARARASILRFSDRAAAMAAADDFDRELRDEAIAAASGAAERLTN